MKRAFKCGNWNGLSGGGIVLMAEDSYLGEGDFVFMFLYIRGED